MTSKENLVMSFLNPVRYMTLTVHILWNCFFTVCYITTVVLLLCTY